MGSGNTKQKRIGIERPRKEKPVDLQSHKNDKLPSINVVEPTAAQNRIELKTAQEPTEEKTATEPVSVPKYDDPILMRYAQENPELLEIFNDSFEAVRSLKECLESNSLLPTKTSQGANSHGLLLGKMYWKRKDRQSRLKLGSFLVELGLPKVVCDILVTLRTRYPEASTWDRKIKVQQTQPSVETTENVKQEEKLTV